MQLDVSKDKRFSKFKELMEDLKEKYNISTQEIMEISENMVVPINIFNDELSGFETIVKFLIENKKVKQNRIVNLTGRSKQNISQTYKNSISKHSKRFKIRKSKFDFPLKIIRSKYSVFESIVKYLKEEHSLSYVEISRILMRNEKTIWTVYNRSKKK